ncbi:ANTAR domain-containing protein [Streptomyces anandii]|uniref:ANTAR domain-containing protein n=1 Tax=Streptomyces anandii TaxID=285454 RepID=UPI003795D3C1
MQFRSGISDPSGEPAVWDVITMDKPLNGTPVRTTVHTVPGRESLLTKISDLQEEIGQLQEAIASHAVIDQAIGVVITLGALRPDQGFEVLREVSQHTNIKLRQICEHLLDWVHSEQLSDEIRTALDKALAAARSSEATPLPSAVSAGRQSGRTN